MLRFAVLLLGALVLVAHAHARSAEHVSREMRSINSNIDKVIKKIRHIILNGDSKKGITITDPFVISQWKFNISEPNVVADGSISDARLRGLGAFVVEKSENSMSFFPPSATVNIKVRVPLVSGTGNYRLNGTARISSVGKNTIIDSEEKFTVVVKNTVATVDAVVSMNYKVKRIVLRIHLGNISVDVQGAGEVGDIIKKEAVACMKRWFTKNRSNLEKRLANITKTIIEETLG